MNEGLRPCPFCGGKARRYVSVKNLVHVYCPSSNHCSVHPCTDFYEKQKDADEAWNRRVNDACRMGMRALEAQLPKKPKHTHISYTGVRSGICQCGKHLEESNNFCSNCGQAIDWWNWSEKE